MKDPNWLRRQLKTAQEEVARMPEWKLWGAEIETRDTTLPPPRQEPLPEKED